MVLPSQNAQSERRTNMFRRRRFLRLPIIVIGLVALVAVGWFIVKGLWPGPDEAQANDTGTTIAADTTGSRTPPSPSTGGGGAEGGNGERTTPPPAGRQSDDPATSDDPVDEAADESRQPVRIDEETAASIRARQMFKHGITLIGQQQPIEARLWLTRAHDSGQLTDVDRMRARVALNDIGDTVTFSREVHPQDTYARTYIIKGGDSLERIVRSNGYLVHWKFLQRINEILDPSKIRENDKLKVLTGPFHAVVDKSDFRLDLYLGEGEDSVLVRSFDVGLGELDSTPVGRFMVGTKTENPAWTNPRTREHFDRNDPKNPIGEYWLALTGIDENTRGFTSYGIHGTIEPDSIGQQQSMGCVRMLPNDVAIIYEALMTDVSIVEIQQ